VNRTLVMHTMIQRALSPARSLLVLAIAGFPAMLLAFAPQIGPHLLESGGLIALILGAGLIGQETSSGVIQLLLARPVSRAEYVYSRWFAVGAFAAAVVLVEVTLGASVMALRGVPPPIGATAIVAVEQVLAAFGLLSVLALFSSLLPGVGDVLAWVVANVAGGVLQMVGGAMRVPGLVRASEEIGRFLSPTLSLHGVYGGGVISWFQLISYFSTVTACLALAILVLNRREFSYATD
jgi:ABC-type transport system involved in multi-copper enzyme maturation permease subunit